MQLDLTHRHGRYIDVACGEATLFRYVYQPDVARVECPKPYFHPIRTLQGNAVTAYRPHDHRWHHGLAMTLTDVSGENYWGGGTFVLGQGYVQLDNVGRQDHAAWRRVEASRDGATLVEELDWISASGETQFKEERTIRVVALNTDEGYWTFEFGTRIENVTDRELAIGSPTTKGRPNAGYGGLFWRGPRSFRGGKVIGAEGRDGQDVNMGARGPWLAFVGKHDEVNAESTLIFIDGPGNPRYPTKWFVRSDPYACVSFAFMFDEVYALPAGERFELVYRIAVADGAWDREAIEAVAAREQAGLASR